MSDDIFEENQTEAFKKISNVEHKNKLTENYQAGYHGGLIHTMEQNQEELVWKIIKENIFIEKEKVMPKLQQFVKMEFEKMFFSSQKKIKNGSVNFKKAKAERKQGEKSLQEQESSVKKKSESKGLDF